MGKASRKDRGSMSAREQVRAQIAAEQAAKERRSKMKWVGGTLLAILLIFGLVLAVTLANRGSSSAQTGPLSPSQMSALKPSEQVVDTVGAGTLLAGPERISGTEKRLVDGKVEVLYAGADYCPFCAGMRWSLADALSRFGAWDEPLEKSSSASAPEVHPDTSTVSFSGAKLTSDTVEFIGYETAGREMVNGRFEPKDTISDEHTELLAKLNAPPYVEPSYAGSIPFISIGGTTIISGALFDTGALSGMTHDQITAVLSDPESPVTQGIVGGGNVITAAICEQLDDAPADVCQAPGVLAAAGKLAGP